MQGAASPTAIRSCWRCSSFMTLSRACAAFAGGVLITICMAICN